MPRSRPTVVRYSGPEDIKLHCETVYAFLMARCGGYPNDHALACMLSSLSGMPTGMPRRLGLSPVLFSQMIRHHFPSAKWPDSLSNHGDDLDASRADERKQLTDLIWRHRWHDHASVLWIAQIIAAGCMGSDHLWQDLGLWSRHDLSELIRRNFPALALRNNRDMKWKKFLYKQLCIQDGIHTCRAPSCDVCVDYASCFGLEE
jgi:nitrogen fixation protein NifQ